MSYSPTDYWAELHRRDDLSAVGQSGLPTEINRWLYRILARNLRAFLRRHDLLRPPPAAMFDDRCRDRRVGAVLAHARAWRRSTAATSSRTPWSD